MRNSMTFNNPLAGMPVLRKQAAIALIMALALLAFEMFNFDTTQYALANLLGDVAFLGLRWATILAVAFCAIDFAGLVRFFTPEKGREEPKEVWYLMGAWLLGATMNALMTWWAISLTLLNHQFGNEVLSREQLLQIVPIFVAVLVWLTRILFIGGITLAGDHMLGDLRATATRAVHSAPAPRAPAPRAPAPRMPAPHASAPARSAPPSRPTVSAAAGQPELKTTARPLRPQRTDVPQLTRPDVTPPVTAATPVEVDEAYQPDPYPDPAPQVTPVQPRRPIAPQPQPAHRAPDNRNRQRPPMPPLGQRLPFKARSSQDD